MRRRRKRRGPPAVVRDADGIRWLERNHWERHSPEGELALNYGRCRSGKRWFWTTVLGYYWADEAIEETGWTESEADALDEARNAVRRMVNGRHASARFRPGMAYMKLKAINSEKRKARPPPSSTDFALAEYLYGYRYFLSDYTSESELSVKRFRIFKRTAKKIFYDREGEYVDHGTGEPDKTSRTYNPDNQRTASIDRQTLETTGRAENRSEHWSSHGSTLYASLDLILAQHRKRDNEPELDLAALKRAMADAHPDHGGTDAAFIEARKKYMQAKRTIEMAE